MADPEDAAYRKNVRNMLLVLAAIVLTVFAAIFIPPFLSPFKGQFDRSVSVNSPQGFSLTIQLNSTALSVGESVSISAWINNTSSQVLSVSASDGWPVDDGRLWTKICTAGWPLGVGVMSGYFTADNYSSGTLVVLPMPLVTCPTSNTLPISYLIRAQGSSAVVKFNATFAEWTLASALTFVPGGGAIPQTGVFTAVAADEWGDIVLTHFRVS